MKAAPKHAQGERLECGHCFRERIRRARVLDLKGAAEDAADKLNAPAFAASIYITAYNNAVCFYGRRRARKFAEASKQQLL